MAVRYRTPPYRSGTPLIPSQQSSLPLTRTALNPHLRMLAIEASSDGPSKIPQASAQAYCVPDRLAPCRWTVLPSPSTKWLPVTRMDSPPDRFGAPLEVARLEGGPGRVP